MSDLSEPLTAEGLEEWHHRHRLYGDRYPVHVGPALATIDALSAEAERLRRALALHWGEDGSQHTVVPWAGCHLCAALVEAHALEAAANETRPR